ncbi:DUF935 domain-containing protein [Desulfocurvibacter africanus]|uniref:DUF935 domain-containing protein n=1 Tax=Desulfocurvibacter africanus subsp. africanus str. Walvis Bay TaxID=690850 RepID=F3YW09_DESAF|nr:DUF935 domain-containing protein [Desulfocurvibacter africanus]EGJ49039.1 protein of unknown function DUF935 [Desulfocurvibacter africanus subsp. africanus str. Walvis Bay]
MPEPTLYDHMGRPIRRQELTREHAAPSLMGVRSVWDVESIAAGLTPGRLAAILRDAAQGDHRAYLTLAEEMEEREPHYASVLGTRKRAVAGLEPVVEAASDDKADVDLADKVRELTRRPAFRGLLFDALDGLGKGFAVVEILWDRTGRTWWPRFEWRDPRHFVWDREDGRTLRLLDETDMMLGIPLAPYKFVVHMPRIKSGLPIRNGLARLAAVTFMCKSYTLTDWLAFAEVFGMPLRVGRYGPGASEEDIRKLVSAVANIGSDAAAVVPESMRIEFVEGGKAAGGHELFLGLAEWLDKQVSKAILGQTMTADDGASLSQAKVHNDVRRDIQVDDALQLEASLNRDLVKPFIDLNFGPQENYPRLRLPVPEPEDRTGLVEALAKLVPLGLRVEASGVRDKLGLPDPEDDAELLSMPGVATAENRQGKALNQSQGVPAPRAELDEIDELEADALAEWEQLAAPVVNPVLKLAEEAGSFEDFLAKLPGLSGTMDSSALIRSLALAAFKARGLGDAGDEV